MRQRLHSDELHFSSKKQTSTFQFPITIGPFTVRNKVVVEFIDDMMACFDFYEEPFYQYDPHHLISKRRKKQKRRNYEHQGNQEMDLMANKLTLPSDPEKQNELINLVTTPSIPIDAKGERKIGQEALVTSTTCPSAKKPKLFKDSFL